MKTKTYKLLIDIPVLTDKDRRDKLILKEWNKQFPKLIGTMDFIADMHGLKATPPKYSRAPKVKYVDMDFGRGEPWINDKGEEDSFWGIIITVETKASLENHVPQNRIYLEDNKRNDFRYGEKYCILHGESNMTEHIKSFIEVRRAKSASMGLLDLYQYPEKIKELEVRYPPYLVVDTSTEKNKRGALAILKMIKDLEYAPQRVFFLGKAVSEAFSFPSTEVAIY